MERWLAPLFTTLVALLGLLLLLEAAVAMPSGGTAPRTGQAVRLAGTSVDEMSPQMRHAYIVGIQEELAAHGYRAGPPDGAIGHRTRLAIEQYQRDAGLPIDGEATKELLDHLKFARPKVYAPQAVYYGDPGDAWLVREIQTQLQALGYYHGAVDGIAGPATLGAASRFRSDNGLPQSGALDLELLDRIRTANPAAGPQ